jgi:hypothetical protein
VKIITTIALVFSFSLFLDLALVTQGQAEEYYIYKDSHGNLVISNKLPPTGSIIIKRHELPQVQESREGGEPQLKGSTENSAKPSKRK